MKRIGSSYFVSWDDPALGADALGRFVKKDLTIKQRGGEKYGFADGKRITLYRETMNGMEVPRAYGRREFGPPDEDETVVAPVEPFHFTKDLRPHQVPLVEDFMSRLRSGRGTDAYGGIFNASCGTGKTVVAIKVLADLGQKALILVHTGFLMKQWREEIERFTDLPPEKVGKIQQGVCEWKGKSIVIGMVESLSRREYEPEMYSAFGAAAFDECVTGDSEIHTDKGIIPIADFPSCSPNYALSFNGLLERWEYRRIARWIPRGLRKTLLVRAGGLEIRCTPEHPFITEEGEVAAGDLRPGMRVLSPALADAGNSSRRLTGVDERCAFMLAITPGVLGLTGRNGDDCWRSRLPCVRVVVGSRCDFMRDLSVIVERHPIGLNSCRATILLAETEDQSPQKLSPCSTAHCLGTRGSIGRMGRPTRGSHSRTGKFSGDGPSTKHPGSRVCAYEPESSKARGSESGAVSGAGCVTPDLGRCFASSGNPSGSRSAGFLESPRRDGPGGIWTMGLASEEDSSFTPRDFKRRMSGCLSDSSGRWDSERRSSAPRGSISFRDLGSRIRFGGSGDSSDSPPPGWGTSFLTITEIVEDQSAGVERVYDLEVEGNHNFVANGFLVHNCHRHAAATWHKVISMFPARTRIGLSATPRRGDGLWKIITHNVGDVLTKGEVGGTARVFRVMTGVAIPDSRYLWGGQMYLGALLKALTNVHRRNDIIAQEIVKALRRERRVLVLSDRLAHLDELEALTKEQWGDANGLKIGRYVGGISEAKIAEAQECNLLFGTFQYAKEGLDDPGLDTLMLAVPKGDVEQPIGRILRVVKGKKEPLVVDFVDDKTSVCSDFAARRLAQYSRLGYEVVDVQPKSG